MIIGLMDSAYNPLLFVTIIFILLPALLGYSIIRKAKNRDLSIGQKIRLLIYGLIGLFFWAGYIVGPLLVIISSLMKLIKRKKSPINNTKNYE
jgi:hypothetical protein